VGKLNKRESIAHKDDPESLEELRQLELSRRENKDGWPEHVGSPQLNLPHAEIPAKLWPAHPAQTSLDYERLKEVFGTDDRSFISGLCQQLIEAGSRLGGNGIDFMLAVIRGIKPKDQLEAMLATQIAAFHVHIMTFVSRLAVADNIAEQDSAERALNKLTRTFTAQMEALALKRHRTGGEQKVTVQHVSMGDGSQAIVGSVAHTKHETALEKLGDAAPALTDARQAEMQIIREPERAPVPLRRKKDGRRSSS
jgi:hypothetical protein